MTEARSIPPGASGVIAGNAFICGEHARLLVQLIGAWRVRFVEQRIPADRFNEVDEAVTALAAAAISARGNAEAQPKRNERSFEAWMNSRQLADAVRLTPNRIGQLRRNGEVEAVEVSTGRFLFPPSSVEHLLNRQRRT